MIPGRIDINTPRGFTDELPRMSRVKVRFAGRQIQQIADEVRTQIEQPEIDSRIKPGQEIAVGCGSRGVANMFEIAASVVKELKKRGAVPFIFPAMGSHGGSTAAGQVEILASHGITEEFVGCPVKSSMETVQVGELDDNTPIYLDKFACEADGIVLINRVKPHTTFRGDIESGIIKMMVIGMGKAKGADIMHTHGFAAFGELLPKTARVIMTKVPFLFGIATVENAFHETALIKAMPPQSLIADETELQQQAKKMMGSLFFEEIDVLILEQMGKDISGAGFDPNIAGRNNRHVEWDGPLVKKIVVLDLTAKTDGNAIGMGLADVITMEFFNKIDFETTYTNVVSSNLLDGGAIPMIANTEQQAILMAAMTVEKISAKDCKLIKLRNTLEISEIMVSEPLWPQVNVHPDMELLGDPFVFQFDDKGSLLENLAGEKKNDRF